MSYDSQMGTSYNYYMPPLSKAIKFLLITNGLIFIFQILFNQASGFFALFGLTPSLVLGKGMVWQLATYMFLHANFMHILLNSIALYFFGTDVEREMGTRNFCILYFFTGVGAGLCTLVLSPTSIIPTVGASGAIFGILMAYAILFPNRIVTLLLFFVLPIQMRARYLAIFFGLIEVLFLLSERGQSGIARVAHLGGLLFGYLYMRYEILILDFVSYCEKWIFRREQDNGETGQKEDYIRRSIDPILDKISKKGIHSLTWRERRILKRAKKKYFNENVSK